MKPQSLIAVLPLLVATACSDFATAPNRVPVEFRMTPDSVLVTEGETVTFQYTVLDEDGTPYTALPGWASPLWTFSRDSVFTVDASGLGRALGPGAVQATAQVAGLEAAAELLVNPAEMRIALGFDYITQSVQTRTGAVPLVAGRDGLLRVYLRGDKPNFFTPKVHATFSRDGAVVHTEVMEADRVGIPGSLDEGDLRRSYDVEIPGTVLQPGTRLVLEIDPEGVVPASSSSTLRIPATGEASLDIVDVPPFRVRLVPVTQSLNGLESRFTADNAMDRLALTRAVFPLAEFDVDVRTPYTTDAALDTDAGWYALIEEIATLRLDDDSPRYYYGGFRRPTGTNILGLGYVGYPVAIGTDAYSETIAHEIGHTLSLPHAPCGDPAGADPNYPYPGGFIGQYGYDARNGRLLDPDERYDLMTYCDPTWISDYNYERVLAYRDTSSFDAVFRTSAADDMATGGTTGMAAGSTLIVHAGVRRGALRLGPVVESAAPAVLPEQGGRYTLEGLDEAGAVLFSLSFEPRPLDHEDAALFSAAIPAGMAQPDRLATLRLTGPEGVLERGRAGTGAGPQVRLSEDPGGGTGPPVVRWDAGAYPLAVVRDRATGRIVAMSRTGRLALPGDPSALDVTLSDGVRSHPADVRRR